MHQILDPEVGTRHGSEEPGTLRPHHGVEEPVHIVDPGVLPLDLSDQLRGSSFGIHLLLKRVGMGSQTQLGILVVVVVVDRVVPVKEGISQQPVA